MHDSNCKSDSARSVKSIELIWPNGKPVFAPEYNIITPTEQKTLQVGIPSARTNTFSNRIYELDHSLSKHDLTSYIRHMMSSSFEPSRCNNLGDSDVAPSTPLWLKYEKENDPHSSTPSNRMFSRCVTMLSRPFTHKVQVQPYDILDDKHHSRREHHNAVVLPLRTPSDDPPELHPILTPPLTPMSTTPSSIV